MGRPESNPAAQAHRPPDPSPEAPLAMPMYEFRCEPCDHAFETLVRGPDDLPRCPRCRGSALVKEFSVPAAARGAGARGNPLPIAPPMGGGGCGAGGCGSGMCGMG